MAGSTRSIRHADGRGPRSALAVASRSVALDDSLSRPELDKDRRTRTAARPRVDASAHREAPFFIIGSPRSGTSLLSRMLNGHSRLAVPFETTIVEIFHDMARVYEPLDDIDNRRRLVVDILDFPTVQEVRPRIGVEQAMAAIEREGIGGVMDGMLAAWARQQGKCRWGEKTPSNVFHFDSLADWFPQAKLVHIIRDGRDVAKSLVGAPFGPKTLFTAARRWERHVRAGQEIGAGLPSSRYLELRYEELLDRPEAELKRICDFLEERFDPAMLHYFEEPVHYPTDPANARNLGRRVIKGNSQKWRRTMTPAEVEIVEAAVAPMLRGLAYETMTPGRQVNGMEALFRMHLEPLPHRALSVFRNRGGQIEALARLRLQAKYWRATLLDS